jgi:hypothetical protein
MSDDVAVFTSSVHRHPAAVTEVTKEAGALRTAGVRRPASSTAARFRYLIAVVAPARARSARCR